MHPPTYPENVSKQLAKAIAVELSWHYYQVWTSTHLTIIFFFTAITALDGFALNLKPRLDPLGKKRFGQINSFTGRLLIPMMILIDGIKEP